MSKCCLQIVLEISQWIIMMTLVTENWAAKVEMVSRTTLSNNRKERLLICRRICHKHYHQSVPVDYGGENSFKYETLSSEMGKQRILYAKQSSLQGMEHDYHSTTFQTTTAALRRKVLGRVQWNFKPRWSCRNARIRIFIKRKICGRVQSV